MFRFQHPGVHVMSVQWSKVDSRPKAISMNHPMSVNLNVVITWHGVTSCHLVAGTSKQKSSFTNAKGDTSNNITAHEYRYVLRHILLPCGDKFSSSNSISNWVL